MASFDDLVQRTAEAAGVMAGKSAVIVKKAAGSAKGMVHVGKLNVDIAAERDSIRRNYILLGKLYYQNHKNDPEPDMEQLVGDILRSEEKIASLQSEIELVRASSRCEDAEFEQKEDDTGDFADFADAEEKQEEAEETKED